MVFEESDTAMLVAMPLPPTDLFHDGLSPWQRCVELAQENPDRRLGNRQFARGTQGAGRGLCPTPAPSRGRERPPSGRAR